VRRPPDLVTASFGRERYANGSSLARHRHADGYIALVLSGGYVEAGDGGRRRVVAGDVLIHQPFEAHLNAMAPSGAEVLNLPMADWCELPASGRVSDPDLIARLAERDCRRAAAALMDELREGVEPLSDWPDLLAAVCRSGQPVLLSEWARRHGLAAATVSRGFAKAYGVSPARYRLEARSHRAWKDVCATRESLAHIAAESGFSDQAHMTRSIATLTGQPAGRWRRPGQIRSRPN
jgi:AraC-like DNA-binding protein